MLMPRVIPLLLLRGEGLVKGVRFKDHKYVGDFINAVKIFSDKEVDELIFLDILARKEGRIASSDFIQRIADECFMPFSVSGGIRAVEVMRDLLSAGPKKVSINSAAVENPALIKGAAEIFGRQSVIVAIDVRETQKGSYKVYTHGGSKPTKLDPVNWAIQAEEKGVGEILLTSIERDGTMQGYDLTLIKMVSGAVSIPVITCEGAGKAQDLGDAVRIGGASAAAAGSLFVFYGPERAVLISLPSKKEVERAVQ